MGTRRDDPDPLTGKPRRAMPAVQDSMDLEPVTAPNGPPTAGWDAGVRSRAVTQLQGTAGNSAVQRLLGGVTVPVDRQAECALAVQRLKFDTPGAGVGVRIGADVDSYANITVHVLYLVGGQMVSNSFFGSGQVTQITANPKTSGTVRMNFLVEQSLGGRSYPKQFRVNIIVPQPEPKGEVRFGPTKAKRDHEVLFERPRQSRISERQRASLIAFYERLSPKTKELIESGAEPVNLEGHASTTGSLEANQELSNRRMEAVSSVLSQFVGSRGDFPRRAVGEHRAGTGDNVEVQEERKVVLTIWETIAEGEPGTQ